MRILCKVENDDIQTIVAELRDAYIHHDSNWLRCNTTDDDELVITGITNEDAHQMLHTLLSVGYVDASQFVTYMNEEPPEDEKSEEECTQDDAPRKRGFFNRDPWDRH